MNRNAPDAEKPENVIDAEGIEIAAHLREAPLPPGKTILFHPLPVVGGELPVLPLGREWVGRRARLHVHVIKWWFLPRVSAVAVDANRNVPFQNDAFRMSVRRCLSQLQVQMELNE